MPSFKVASIVVWVVVVSAISFNFLHPSQNEKDYDMRAPFAIILPELSDQSITDAAIKIKAQKLPTLRTIKLRVGNPYADEVGYESIFSKVNGESAGQIKTSKPAIDGKIIELDLGKYDRFKLKPGKNVIEVEFTVPKSRDGKNSKKYYASYVLMPDNLKIDAPAITLAAPEKFTGRKFAVLIGISDYKNEVDGLTDLRYADKDAQSMRDFLRSAKGGGFKEDEILYLVNDQAAIGVVRDKLTGYLSKATPQDLVYLFIAGHGFPDPYDPRELYFAMHDSLLSKLPQTALKMTELLDILKKNLKAGRVIALIDTCHSAGLEGKKLVIKNEGARGQRVENNLVNFYAGKIFQERGWAVMTSSDVAESSLEGDQWGDAQWGKGHGVFTWAVLEGFNGKADANTDGLITAGELFNFVRDFVRRETGGNQNPVTLPGGNANLTLAAIKDHK